MKSCVQGCQARHDWEFRVLHIVFSTYKSNHWYFIFLNVCHFEYSNVNSPPTTEFQSEHVTVLKRVKVSIPGVHALRFPQNFTSPNPPTFTLFPSLHLCSVSGSSGLHECGSHRVRRMRKGRDHFCWRTWEGELGKVPCKYWGSSGLILSIASFVPRSYQNVLEIKIHLYPSCIFKASPSTWA